MKESHERSNPTPTPAGDAMSAGTQYRSPPLPVGPMYSVEFILTGGAPPLAGMSAEWSPRIPPPCYLGRHLEAYRRARSVALRSAFPGVAVAVLEVKP